MHDGDSIRHKMRFGKIVGHHQQGNAGVLMQGFDEAPDILPKIGIQGRQRLVQQ